MIFDHNMPPNLMKIAWNRRRNIEKNWSETKLSEKDATSIPIEKNHMILMIFLNYLIDFLLENHSKINQKRSQPRDHNFLWNSIEKAPKMTPKCSLKSLKIYEKSYQISASIFIDFRASSLPKPDKERTESIFLWALLFVGLSTFEVSIYSLCFADSAADFR